jgi:hypothetical protein
MARNHDEETPLDYVPKQTYEASKSHRLQNGFAWFLALRFSLARFGFSESRPRRRSMLMFWIICLVSGKYQNPSTSRLTSVRLWALFLGLPLSPKPILPKAHRTPEPSHSGLPHERIEQRHC